MKSLRSKILIILLIMTLLPLLVATIYSYQLSNRAIRNKLSSTSIGTLKTISKSIDSEILQLTTQMLICTSTREMQGTVNELKNSKTDGGQYVALRHMDELMIGVFRYTNSITGIYLTMPNGKTYPLVDGYRLDVDLLPEQPFFQNSDNNNGTLVNCGLVEVKEDTSALVFGRVLRDSTDRGDLSLLGSIHFMVDPQLFNGITSEGEFDSTFLFDTKGRIIAHDGDLAEEDAQGVYDSYASLIASNHSGSESVAVNGAPMVLLYDVSDKYSFKILRLVPQSVYSTEVSRFSSMTLVFAIICVAAAIVVSLLVSKNISTPIGRLNQAMLRAETGNLEVCLPTKRKDEIGQITRRFNKMVTRLKQVFEQSIEDEKQKRKLEISALQYQINPHFLYNILTSVRSLAMVEEAPQTSEMLAAVAKLMKSTVGSTGTSITLSQEIENIRRLLYIQNVCHSGCIQWEIEVEEGLGSCRIPNLVLQPIVENAVFYGSNPETGRTDIQVSAKTRDGALLLSVEDRGPGISNEIQSRIFSGQEAETHMTHIGLRNTNERIKLNYGTDYGISIQSSERGATVQILLPKIFELDLKEQKLP